jgi:purine-binding chemotaxis protein CheW
MEKDENNISAKINLLVFHLNDQLYAFDISVVEELIPLPELTHIGSTLPFIKGVIDLRGTIIPAMDLKVRLGLESKEYELDNAIIVVKVAGLVAGLIIDSGSFVMEFPSREISSSPEMIKGMHQEYIAGWGRSEKGLFILLHPEKLLNKEEIATLQKISTSSS